MLTNLGSLAIPSGGDNFTVDRGSFTSSTSRVPFSHLSGPGYRAVYNLANLSQSRFALAGGQSGHIGSAHYGDLVEGWRDGKFFTIGTDTAGSEQLTLVPKAP